MELPEDLKYLYVGWLEEEAVNATVKGNRTALTYSKALDKLRQHANNVYDPKDLIKIPFIGEKIVGLLTKKLKKYCESNGYLVPGILQTPNKDGSKRQLEGEEEGDIAEEDQIAPKRRKNKKYVPAQRSGGYAILLGLYDYDPDRTGMMKDEVIKKATPLCDKSFQANPATNQFYSAWNSIKTLIKNDLVKDSGRPVHYYLTDEGVELARSLKRVEGLASSPVVSRTNGDERAETRDIGDEDDVTEWTRGSYEVLFIVDNREVRSQTERNYISNKLDTVSLKHEVRALSIGDGVWIARNKHTKEEAVLDFIFERKRLDDLVASIKDGRHFEQKFRLSRTGLTNIYYIVEEVILNNVTDLSKMTEAIKTSISMTMTNSKFLVKRTKDMDDTIQLLIRMTNQIKSYYEDRDLLVIKTNSLLGQLDYSARLNSVKETNPTKTCVYNYSVFSSMMKKNDLITVKEMFIRMLMTTKGVSLQKAITVQKHFKTPKKLLEAYLEVSEDQKRTYLSNLFKNEIGDRKIGPSLSEKIAEVWG